MQLFIVVTVFALFSATVVAAVRRGRTSISWACALVGQSVLVLLPIVVPVSKLVRLSGVAALFVVAVLAAAWAKRRRQAAEPGIAADRPSAGR